jgi:hypothetical protein
MMSSHTTYILHDVIECLLSHGAGSTINNVEFVDEVRDCCYPVS